MVVVSIDLDDKYVACPAKHSQFYDWLGCHIALKASTQLENCLDHSLCPLFESVTK